MSTIFSNIINLQTGEDNKLKTLETVKNNISFTGANLWILACAIIVASVGLNVNSTAVIIGAMLISPLMGPIVASGFALGIYDFELLKRALRNLLLATVASLLVSTIYFLLSPFKEVQSELLSRTAPNIYDILIAFFGGLVGVIAVTRVEKGNPIPGVAIATALMPPLCTAGYGLATGQFKFFFGAFFLYSINCVFICIATFVIVKYLNYPAKVELDLKHQKQIRYGISIIITLMLLPACYFAYSLFKQQQFGQNVNNYIEKELAEKGYTVVYKKTYYNSKPKKLELAFLSKEFSQEEEGQLNEKLKEYGITNTVLKIKQSNNLQLLKSDILNEVSKKATAIDIKDKKILDLENQIAANSFDNKQVLLEAKTLFPEVKSVSLANHVTYYINDSTAVQTVLLYTAAKELNNEERNKLGSWLKEKLKKDTVIVIPEK